MHLGKYHHHHHFRTGLQSLYGYGNSHCLMRSSSEVSITVTVYKLYAVYTSMGFMYDLS